MKKRVFSAILTLCLLLTMMPTVAFAADDDEAANTNISSANATETSGTNTTIKDIDQNEWTVTTAENCITME